MGNQFKLLDCPCTFYGTFVSQIVLQQILALPALELSGIRTFISLRIEQSVTTAYPHSGSLAR